MVSFHHRLFVHAMILRLHGTQCLTSKFTAIIITARRCKQENAAAALLHNRQQWFSTLSSAGPINQDDYLCAANNDDHEQEKTWLVVGDGDLSYSASVASSLNECGIQLLASVLEDQETHQQIYRNSKKHSDTISRFQRHKVLYGVDATALDQQRFIFPTTTTSNTTTTTTTTTLLFDRVIFNFPHWKGKSNNRYNQQLLDGFFQSVVKVIQPETDGQVHVALVTGQGGMEASNIQEWKQSWMVAMHANNHGLLLRQVQPFQVDYDLSSHRGVDRAFSTGKEPFQYIFGLAKRNGEAVQERFQIACRHELRIRLNSDGTTATGVNRNSTSTRTIYSLDELQSEISALAQRMAPVGIRVEIPWNEIITPSQQSSVPSLLVFLIVYAGQSVPLSRATANEIRSRLEMAVQQELGLEIAKPGRMVSKPFPYSLLDTLLRENIDMGKNN